MQQYASTEAYNLFRTKRDCFVKKRREGFGTVTRHAANGYEHGCSVSRSRRLNLNKKTAVPFHPAPELGGAQELPQIFTSTSPGRIYPPGRAKEQLMSISISFAPERIES